MHIDDDDLPTGRVLTRREAVRLLALSGGALVAGCGRMNSDGAGATAGAAGGETAGATAQSAAPALPRCVAKPELTVGPYFVDTRLERSDIRVEPGTNEVKEGARLQLTFNVQQIAGGACTPLAGAMVDVWQCDALGAYSAVDDQIVGFDTQAQRFLRGYQVTDAQGRASLTTIYPGWYQGRAVHIHFKIRNPASGVLANDGNVYEFTSQLFFDETLTDRVHAQQPYAAKGERDRHNESDGIFRQSGGVLVLDTTSVPGGYEAVFDVGLDLSDAAVGRADAMERGGPGGPPPGGQRP